MAEFFGYKIFLITLSQSCTLFSKAQIYWSPLKMPNAA